MVPWAYQVLREGHIHGEFIGLFVGGWVKHRADNRGKVIKSKYKSFVTSLERAEKKTGWAGKKLIIHLLISVTNWVWMASRSQPLVNSKEG